MNYYFYFGIVIDLPKFSNQIFNMATRLIKGEKKLFGVCSGLANYFNLDPTIMRIIFIAAFLCFGTGLLLYLILALVMPDK
jgi:phage shock protein C